MIKLASSLWTNFWLAFLSSREKVCGFFSCVFVIVVHGEYKHINNQIKYAWYLKKKCQPLKNKKKKINNPLTYSLSFWDCFVFHLGCSAQFQLELVLVVFPQHLTLRPVCDWASSALIDLICTHNSDGIIHCKVHLWAFQNSAFFLWIRCINLPANSSFL